MVRSCAQVAAAAAAVRALKEGQGRTNSDPDVQARVVRLKELKVINEGGPSHLILYFSECIQRSAVLMTHGKVFGWQVFGCGNLGLNRVQGVGHVNAHDSVQRASRRYMCPAPDSCPSSGC